MRRNRKESKPNFFIINTKGEPEKRKPPAPKELTPIEEFKSSHEISESDRREDHSRLQGNYYN